MACRKCDLVYVAFKPELKDLHVSYAEAAFDSNLEAADAARSYSQILSPIISHLPDKLGAIDIGTGDGAFLKELISFGFKDIIGVEPSNAPIETAAPEIRKMIHHGVFRAGLFPRSTFSLITCFQTIEHVPDPLELAETAYDLLKPGGYFGLVCHNRRSFSAKALGRKSPIYDIEHLQLFSKSSIANLFDRSKFRNIVVNGISNRYSVAYWTKLFPFPRKLKLAILWGLDTTKLSDKRISLPAGNMVCYGQKI